MTAVSIRFGDAQLAVRDLLRQLLASRTEPEADGVTVSTLDLPGADESRPLPFVRVRTLSQSRTARLDGRGVVRLSVWHADEGAAASLAALAEALLLGAHSDTVRGCAPVSGPLPSEDPSGVARSDFSVSARLRPSQLPQPNALPRLSNPLETT